MKPIKMALILCCAFLLASGLFRRAAAQVLVQPSSLTTENPPDYNLVLSRTPRPAFVSPGMRLLVAPELPDAPDEWIGRSLKWVDYILETFPPSLPEYPARRAALARLDDIMHIETAPRKPAVQAFYKSRMEEAIRDMEHTHVQDGVVVWKLYNHGFIARTKSVTIAFDVVPPEEKEADFSLSADQIQRIAAQADVLFLSHQHGDHISKKVVQAFLSLNKPVLAPPLGSTLADAPEIRQRLRYPKRDGKQVQTVSLRGGDLKFETYPGHQGDDVENNIYLVTTAEGYSLVHTGDQAKPDLSDPDYELFRQIGQRHKVDLLLVNSWAHGMRQIVQGAHPQLILPGHEDEIGHDVGHRIDYMQDYERLFEIGTPYVVMTWGEHLHYLPHTK